MKLSKGTIRPGTVLQVLEEGIIKASAPGLFSPVDDPALLPPIMPWFIGHNSNAFSKLNQYDEVWIMNFADNPRQLYWFRKDNVTSNNELKVPGTDTPIMQEENVEIVCNRDVGGDLCTIYFSDGSGWVISKGESIIQIRSNGSILLSISQPNRCIDINGESISLGKEGVATHSACFGDEVEDVLFSLCDLLNGIAIKALTNPHTAVIGTELLAKLPLVTKKIPNISSQNVTLE